MSDTPSSPLRILLLEDSAFDAELLRENLRIWRQDLDFTWAEDEASFIAALETQRYDIILSDHQLPAYSGGQALEYAQATAPDTPFIFVSGVIGEDNAVELLKRGATDYVTKGRLARLPLAIERALREVEQDTARRAALLKARDADALYGRVIDSLRDYAVILLDAQGHIRSWNSAAESIFGRANAEVLFKSIELLFTPEDRAAGIPHTELATALAQGSSSDDRWLLRADGSKFRAEGVVTPLHSSDGAHSGYSKIVRDVTTAYNASQAVSLAKEEAERANLAKDRFLAVLSHELRTPLAPIVAATHVLERVAQVPEKFAHLLPMIRRNVALEARLIDDLLDLNAIAAGKIRLNFEAVDLHKVVRTVLEMIDGEIKAKRLDLVMALDASPSRVQGDEARLQQVVWNLARNAVKFTPENGSVRLATRIEGDQLLLECVDSGPGIDADALPRIFTAFEQADADVSKRFGGLGLGLAIARGLVNEHGGVLEAHSEGRGRGARFVVRLALHASATADALPAATAHARSPSTAGHAFEPSRTRVLLVEDNVDAAEAIVISLREFGYEVVHAATQREALDIAGGSHFDILVTDLGLPDGNGIDLGERLAPAMPVIALSGYGAPKDLEASARAGFSGHLIKPIDPDALHAKVQAVLGQAHDAL